MIFEDGTDDDISNEDIGSFEISLIWSLIF